jgi:RNA polymerase sigma-70 factor (ECF subfamily)
VKILFLFFRPFTIPTCPAYINALFFFTIVDKLLSYNLLPTHQPYEEKEILQRIANGDETAFKQLVHQFTPLLAPYILKFTKSKERTQEIVQDIFTQMWLSRESLGEVNNFRRYLYVASRNHALNAIRNMMREEKRHQKWLQDQPSAIAGNTAAPDYSPYLGLVEEAVQQLPEQQKKVWVLCRVQRKKYQEVAAEMGLSRETVKKYLQYAQASITKYIQHKVIIALAGLLIKKFF